MQGNIPKSKIIAGLSTILLILKGKKLPQGHVTTRKDGSQWVKKKDEKGGKSNWVMVKKPTKKKPPSKKKPAKKKVKKPTEKKPAKKKKVKEKPIITNEEIVIQGENDNHAIQKEDEIKAIIKKEKKKRGKKKQEIPTDRPSDLVNQSESLVSLEGSNTNNEIINDFFSIINDFFSFAENENVARDLVNSLPNNQYLNIKKQHALQIEDKNGENFEKWFKLNAEEIIIPMEKRGGYYAQLEYNQAKERIKREYNTPEAIKKRKLNLAYTSLNDAIVAKLTGITETTISGAIQSNFYYGFEKEIDKYDTWVDYWYSYSTSGKILKLIEFDIESRRKYGGRQVEMNELGDYKELLDKQYLSEKYTALEIIEGQKTEEDEDKKQKSEKEYMRRWDEQMNDLMSNYAFEARKAGITQPSISNKSRILADIKTNHISELLDDVEKGRFTKEDVKAVAYDLMDIQTNVNYEIHRDTGEDASIPELVGSIMNATYSVAKDRRIVSQPPPYSKPIAPTPLPTPTPKEKVPSFSLEQESIPETNEFQGDNNLFGITSQTERKIMNQSFRPKFVLDDKTDPSSDKFRRPDFITAIKEALLAEGLDARAKQWIDSAYKDKPLYELVKESMQYIDNNILGLFDKEYFDSRKAVMKRMISFGTKDGRAKD